MCSKFLRIPLIDDLAKEPVPPGSQLLVEYDPASSWYNAALAIAVGWLRHDNSRLDDRGA